MNPTMFLATPYYYRPDLPRADVVTAVVIIAVLWFFAALPHGRRVVAFLAPTSLLALSSFPAGSRLEWWLPYQSAHRMTFGDGLACALYLGFGFGFALANFRLATRAHRLHAIVATSILGGAIAWCLTYWALAWAHHASAWGRWLDPWTDAIVTGSSMAFVLAWLPVALYLNRRFRPPPPGLCPRCRYDLRGSIGRPSCPECGMPIPADLRVSEVVK